MHSFAPRFGKKVATAVAVAAAIVALGCLFLISLGLVACGSTATTTSTASGSTEPSTSHQVTSKPVNFSTDDGVILTGHLFGSGRSGVILAHMYPADQTSWTSTAQRLAAEGYLVLTFDFRGYGESGGSKQFDRIDRDVTAAVSEMRRQGASSLVLVGASMGGTASLVAGDQAQALSSIRLAGIATLSAPVEFRGLSAAEAVPRIVVPLLFIAAEKDEGAAGARELEKLSSDKGSLRILPGQDHGTDLLAGAQSDATYQLLLDFLKSAFAS